MPKPKPPKRYDKHWTKNGRDYTRVVPVRLPGALYEQLKTLAEQENRPTSSLIRQWVEQHVTGRMTARTRACMLPTTPAPPSPPVVPPPAPLRAMCPTCEGTGFVHGACCRTCEGSMSIVVTTEKSK